MSGEALLFQFSNAFLMFKKKGIQGLHNAETNLSKSSCMLQN